MLCRIVSLTYSPSRVNRWRCCTRRHGMYCCRYRFDNLSEEERGRALQRARAQDQQAQDLREQVEARRAERERAKKEELMRELEEERRVQREREGECGWWPFSFRADLQLALKPTPPQISL